MKSFPKPQHLSVSFIPGLAFLKEKEKKIWVVAYSNSLIIVKKNIYNFQPPKIWQYTIS